MPAVTQVAVAQPAVAQAAVAQDAVAQAAVAQAAVAQASPGDDVLERMRAIWEQTLGAGSYGVDDDFFEIGGNSLSAIELMTNIRGRFGVELSIAALLDSPTISALAEAIRQQRKG
jgi:acyl carrier protein